MPIENIKVSNSIFTAQKSGLLSESTGIVFDNVDISSASGAAMTINNCSNATLTDCKFTSPAEEKILYTGKNKNVKVK